MFWAAPLPTASLIAQLVKNPPAVQETPARFLGHRKIRWSRDRLPTPVFRICLQCRRPGFHPWVGKIPWRRERLPTPVLWPGEFPWTVYGVTKSWTRSSDFDSLHKSGSGSPLTLPTSLGQAPHSHRPCAFARQSTLHWTGILGVHQYPQRSLGRA